MMGSPVLLANVTVNYWENLWVSPDATEEGLIERKRWLEALPNYVNPAKIICYVGICEKHWKPGFEYKLCRMGPGNRSAHGIRKTLKFYKRQSVEISQPRNSKARDVLSSERGFRDNTS